jgi:hypothetical protein
MIDDLTFHGAHDKSMHQGVFTFYARHGIPWFGWPGSPRAPFERGHTLKILIIHECDVSLGERYFSHRT